MSAPDAELLAACEALLAGGDDERLDAVAERVADGVGADRCWICRLDGEVLRTAGGVAMVLADPRHQPLPIDKGIVGRCARLGRTQRIDDVLEDPDYFAATALTRSELAAPIRHGGRVVGVINVEANRVAAFGDREQVALEAIAALLGPTLG